MPGVPTAHRESDVFTASDFQTRLRAKPFVPFRVTTSSGETYDVKHPEFVLVFRRFLEIGFPVPEDPQFPDRAERVSILHITSVNDLPAAAPSPSPGSNGSG
jgi:hypothetical protein